MQCGIKCNIVKIFDILLVLSVLTFQSGECITIPLLKEENYFWANETATFGHYICNKLVVVELRDSSRFKSDYYWQVPHVMLCPFADYFNL